MSKSIYSLALTDEVVAALDLLARRQGLSRSALADRILADYASCVTYEDRNRRIFGGVAEALEQDYRFRLQSANARSLLLSAGLSYKYNPTLRYSVELGEPVRDRQSGDVTVGTLRVTLRSTSAELNELFDRFFRLWEWAREASGEESQSYASLRAPGQWVRELHCRGWDFLTEEEIADGLLSYVRHLDECMEIFFRGIGDEMAASLTIEDKVRRYVSAGTHVIL